MPSCGKKQQKSLNHNSNIKDTMRHCFNTNCPKHISTNICNEKHCLNIITKKQLDELKSHGCSCESCHNEPVYVHSKCHIDSKLEVKYENNLLTIICSECKSIVFSIKPE